jgi:hypothetical protein
MVCLVNLRKSDYLHMISENPDQIKSSRAAPVSAAGLTPEARQGEKFFQG